MPDPSRAAPQPSSSLVSAASPAAPPAAALAGATPPDEARAVALGEFAAWLETPRRSSVALRVHGDRAAAQRVLNIRLDGVLAHDRPASANRRWLCEAIRAWAPLEVVFPSRDHGGVAGVSGELPRHAALLVERAYGHVLAATRSIPAACDLLRADAQLLEMQVAVATALQPVLQARQPSAAPQPPDWPDELRRMSLGMAEFLHRHAIGLSPVLADPVVMSYTSHIARLQRSLDDECRKARVA
ncbi:MAG: hypothetical protein MUF07_02140 [Steroidobacteraceae bacterium]|jgi:hypothetical protein|nr:hypothetical protein [Steroidobacteraceae bacterium]